MIAIIDYGSGNVQAIKNMFDEINIQSVITSDENSINNADKLILAGVGHFDFTMKRLRNMGLIDILERNVINKKKYILGICVGMQVLGNSSEEGKESGIGWINGKIEKIKLEHDTKPNLPHLGWNSISSNS